MSSPRKSPARSEDQKDYWDLTPAGKDLFDKAMARAKENLMTGNVASKAGCVQWYGKKWGGFTRDDKSALSSHLIALEKDMGKDRADGYLKYLNSHCKAGIPSSFSDRKDALGRVRD